NIPSTHIWGAEAEATWRLLKNHLELGLNLTTLDGEFPEHYLALDRRDADAAGAAAIASGAAPYEWSPEWFAARGSATRDVKDNTPPNLPKLSGGANATWYQGIGSVGMLTSRVEYLYRGDYEARIFNADVDKVPSYGQWNLFVQYESQAQPWRVWMTATNLFDKDGVVGRYVDPYGSGVASNQYIAPRQLVFNFGYSF
ncbi:MAG: TonB-dependent receptor domain-containing protein, partial [Solimonas sp.]